ncbi:hypothetical protein J6590_098045, partial [Homalodisca vitripennis]
SVRCREKAQCAESAQLNPIEQKESSSCVVGNEECYTHTVLKSSELEFGNYHKGCFPSFLEVLGSAKGTTEACTGGQGHFKSVLPPFLKCKLVTEKKDDLGHDLRPELRIVNVSVHCYDTPEG